MITFMISRLQSKAMGRLMPEFHMAGLSLNHPSFGLCQQRFFRDIVVCQHASIAQERHGDGTSIKQQASHHHQRPQSDDFLPAPA